METPVQNDNEAVPTSDLSPSHFNSPVLDEQEIINTLCRMREAEIAYLFPTLNMSNSGDRELAISMCHDMYIISKFLSGNQTKNSSEINSLFQKISSFKQGRGNQVIDNVELVLDIGRTYDKMLYYVFCSDRDED